MNFDLGTHLNNSFTNFLRFSAAQIKELPVMEERAGFDPSQEGFLRREIATKGILGLSTMDEEPM